MIEYTHIERCVRARVCVCVCVCVCTKTSIAPGNLTDTLGISGTYQVYLELGKIRYLQGMTDEALEYLVSMLSL